MTALTQEQRVRRHFSRAAGTYGRSSDIQRAVAMTLAGELELRRGMRVLDVGAGDGALTRCLIAAGTRVTALDTAWGMVHKGRSECLRAGWVQADACALPFKAGSFDRVVSSSSYQWVDDLESAFCEVTRVLVPGGSFHAALFGRRTFDEFFVSLGYAAQTLRRALPDLRRLPSLDEVAAALKAVGFKASSVQVEERRVDFRDAMEVLGWIKAVGSNGSASGFFWGKRLLAALDKEYVARFAHKGGVYAGFEIIWIEAVT